MKLSATFYNSVGTVIKSARTKAGITQTSLASAVGLTRTSISNIEQGRQRLLLDGFASVALALNLEPNDLLKEAMTDYAYASKSYGGLTVLANNTDLSETQKSTISRAVTLTSGGDNGKK